VGSRTAGLPPLKLWLWFVVIAVATPPLLFRRILRLIVWCLFGRGLDDAGDPSAHSCYLGIVVDAGDTSVCSSWFHLGDSSMVGVVVVVFAPVDSDRVLVVLLVPETPPCTPVVLYCSLLWRVLH
jgi:hypothetical protein